jgi:hypothetical protein
MDPRRSTGTAARRRALILAPLLALMLSAGSLAAPPPAPRPLPPAGEGDDVQETLRVLMIVSMKRALSLTPEQELAVVPKIQEILSERERFTREHQAAMRRVQIKLAEDSVPEQEYRSAVSRLDELERQHRDLEVRLRSEVDRSLSARQQAELRVFVPRFRRQMQIQIDQARRLQERSYRGQSPAPHVNLDADGWLEDNEF